MWDSDMMCKWETSVQTEAWSKTLLGRRMSCPLPTILEWWVGQWVPAPHMMGAEPVSFELVSCHPGILQNCMMFGLILISSCLFFIYSCLEFSWEIKKKLWLRTFLCLSSRLSLEHVDKITCLGFQTGISTSEVFWDQGFLFNTHKTCASEWRYRTSSGLCCVTCVSNSTSLSLTFLICRMGRLIELCLPSRSVPRVTWCNRYECDLQTVKCFRCLWTSKWGNFFPSNAYVWCWLLLLNGQGKEAFSANAIWNSFTRSIPCLSYRLALNYATAMMSPISFWAHHSLHR